MPRSGQNPMRWVSRLASPARLTLTTMVHVPNLQGFWSASLEVLTLCLESLRSTTPGRFELVVLDNGSCAEVRDFLFARFAAREIDQLLVSHRNLGKVGGWNLLFSAAQGETVAYADSDVYFMPGWYEASLAVLEAFPQAAMVTAQPIPGDLSLHCKATLEAAAADPALELREGDDLIPEPYVESHRLGLGETPELYAARIRRRRDVRLKRGETEAYVSASHFQFVSRREILRSFFPMETSIPLGDDREFDSRLDEARHWRLSTVEYLVHHMGNRPPDLEEELPWLERGPPIAAEPPPRPAGAWNRRILNSRPVRRLLKSINRKSYELLYLD